MPTRRAGRLLATVLSVTVALCGILLGGCATNPVTGEQDLVLVSESQELALGQQAHQQTLQQYRVYNDAALQQYVDAVGQRLAAVSHRQDLRYTFTLLDSTEINAFALPGGFIYLTRGLLAYMNSEAELAAVLGHEIGHVTARHGVRQASSAQAASIGAGLLSILVPQMRGAAANQTLGLLSTAVLRGYGREHELEADRLGAEYLRGAGYDPGAMLDVIRVLKNQELFDRKLARLEGREPRAYHGLFSTHPDNDTRLKEIVRHAGGEAGGEVLRDRFLDQIDGLVFGENPAEGVVVGDRFVHPDLGITLTIPPQWQLQNLPDKLLLADPAGQALVVVQLAAADNNVSPQAFVKQQLGIDLSAAEAIRPGGLAGVTGLATLSMGNSRQPARVSAIMHGRYGYLFLGLPRAADALARYDAAFRAIALGFRELEAGERDAIEARRLVVTRLAGPVSWQALGQSSPIVQLPADQLRLLNGAGDAPDAVAGSRIKLVR